MKRFEEPSENDADHEKTTNFSGEQSISIADNTDSPVSDEADDLLLVTNIWQKLALHSRRLISLAVVTIVFVITVHVTVYHDR